MHEDIMLLSNNLIYEGRLKCGSEQVAKQALVLRDRKPCTEIHGIAKCGEDCWVQALMQEEWVLRTTRTQKPDVYRVKAVFVDTDLLPAFDSKVGDLVQNPTEAKVVYQVCLFQLCR
jgi:DNA replication ATP-dependent helicase Dna2